ncbi:ADP-ribosylarginine hydrolase Tri1 (Immunity protein Tri1) (Tri1-Sp) [Durusdinium trenchii]|uniref:ADP-ribosylarginine hydrolase Tri1 (Immunity protein Tri1) (Tri1-Sp) n=1 Tax=Durusdinium trenchii TaxID=1381693 RepID=A0ABP0JBL5_9DINO
MSLEGTPNVGKLWWGSCGNGCGRLDPVLPIGVDRTEPAWRTRNACCACRAGNGHSGNGEHQIVFPGPDLTAKLGTRCRECKNQETVQHHRDASKSRERRGGEKSRPVSLAEILLRLERLEATCLTSADSWTGESLCERSVLQPALQALESDAGCWRLLAAQAEKDPGCGSAISALLGLAIGDSVGGPLEFLPVTESFDEWDTNRPCVLQGGRDADGRLLYRHAYNRFQLKPGQWTDDTSMALCLADSLLVKTGYDGGDLRLRWHMWWFHGYCNAFRYDERRHGRSSVGLGGNVAKSLADVERHALRGGPVPEIYGSVANDAGNGSIMRLSPVPIAYHSHVDEAMRIAILQSRASHPSCDAAACCAFMAFFIVKAIAMHKSGGSPSADVRGFVGRAVEGFLASGFEEMKEWQDMEGCGRAEGAFRVRALLGSAPPSLKESNWDWKSPAPKIQQAITERLKGRRYNGHPIIDTYWGAYCMDGLAMALWALWHSKSCMAKRRRPLGQGGRAANPTTLLGRRTTGARPGPMETSHITRNLLLLLVLAAAPGSVPRPRGRGGVYVHGWSGLGLSLCWGLLGALLGVYGLLKGLKLRNPKMRYGGLEMSAPQYVLFVAVTGLAAFLVETWLVALKLDDDLAKRVPLMTGASLVVFAVAAGLGMSIKLDE